MTREIKIWDEDEEHYGREPVEIIAFKTLDEANEWFANYLNQKLKYNEFVDAIVKAGAYKTEKFENIIHEVNF